MYPTFPPRSSYRSRSASARSSPITGAPGSGAPKLEVWAGRAHRLAAIPDGPDRDRTPGHFHPTKTGNFQPSPTSVYSSGPEPRAAPAVVPFGAPLLRPRVSDFAALCVLALLFGPLAASAQAPGGGPGPTTRTSSPPSPAGPRSPSPTTGGRPPGPSGPTRTPTSTPSRSRGSRPGRSARSPGSPPPVRVRPERRGRGGVAAGRDELEDVLAPHGARERADRGRRLEPARARLSRLPWP